MTITLIAAADLNNVIGKDNDLPWRLPKDMRFFMRTTKGHHIIMGRKNFESLPNGPLKDRTNIIITRNKDYHVEGCKVVHTMEDALQIAEAANEPEVFIIGGGEIYKMALAIAHKIYLTRIFHKFDGDTFFPEIDLNIWQKTNEELYLPDDKNAYSFSFQTFTKK